VICSKNRFLALWIAIQGLPGPVACEAPHRIKDAGHRRKPEGALDPFQGPDQAFDIPRKSAPRLLRSPFRQTAAPDAAVTPLFRQGGGRMVAMHRLALKQAQNPCL
jgi:hypothetical protein